jgi:hypothetical protein
MNRAKLTREYQSFKKEAAEALKPLHPEISLFGSMKTKKKSPNDVDVQIDVRNISDSQFRKTRSAIARIRKKYPDVDPVLYSWPSKRLPSMAKRKKLRWSGPWKVHKQIAPNLKR